MRRPLNFRPMISKLPLKGLLDDATTGAFFSEPFAKTGNIAADGFRRLLGCPAQDLLQTMLRESIQNSIDAALPGFGPSLSIRFRTLTSQQCTALREVVLADLPQGDHTRNEIATSIGTVGLKVLEICDFRSIGLSGPTSGDVASDGREALNFVNFLRNVGVARDTYHGGGTYGYGKTSLYAMSACSTILVDSQTTCEGKPVRRFMGCHLGSAFDADTADNKRRRFTGRHWWGDQRWRRRHRSPDRIPCCRTGGVVRDA